MSYESPVGIDRAFLIFDVMEYPLFIKHPKGLVWYRIDSKSSFLELSKLGERFLKSEVQAEDYSTSLYIKDLVDAFIVGDYESTTELEFEAILRQAH